MAATRADPAERKQASPERPSPRSASAEAPSPGETAVGMPHLAGDPARPLSPRQVLQLQRTVGNRAVGQMLSARAAAAGVQRKRAYFKPGSAAGVTSDMAVLHGMAGVLDGHTEAAHAHVVGKLKKAVDPHDPYELAMGDFPHSSDRRFTDWVNKLQGSNDALKSAATGYMIEDIVTAAVANVSGYSSQVATQGARPDFEIRDGTKKGVVDVTSTGDIGHVLDKDFSLASYLYVVESLYPSVDFSSIATTALQVDDSTVAAMGTVRAQRANAKLAQALGYLREQLNLISNAGQWMYGRAVIDAAATARQRIASITSQGPDATLLGELDAQLAIVNANQTVTQLDRVGPLLTWLQGKYGVSGLPPWS